MGCTTYSLYFFSILFIWLQFGMELIVVSAQNETNESGEHAYADSKKPSVNVDIGLILDLNSSMGVMAESCISMAISDFYSAYPHYTTRLALHTNNSGDVLAAASAALELLTKAEVLAIIGPQNSNEAKFVVELGGKAHVPIISFSVTSSSLSPAQTPYFIRTAVADSSQLKAITAIVQGFEWREVVILYENTEYGNSFIPYLTDAFQEAHIQLPYRSAISIHAQDFHIIKELKKLMTMQARVFLVHMTSFLGARLFSLADKAGMMSQGYAWIITDGLSNSLGSMDAKTIESMEGVLGLRPYSPKSKKLENFKMRWEKNCSQINIFGLWAYDTVWALAIAVENIQAENSSIFLKTNVNNEVGPRLLDEILRTRFQGLSGEFKLEEGHLQTPAFEIINIVGNGPNGERTIGYWTPNTGISRKLGSSGADDEHKDYTSTSIEKLKKVIWPGDSTDRPKGWDRPRTDKKLRVGVPKKPGFTEFVNVQEIGISKKYNVTGFSIDVFKVALLPLGLEPEFVPFVNDTGESAGTYDDLVNNLRNQTYDAVVGDITIRANRSLYVDFSLPYSESGVVMVVKVEPDKLKNMWIFLMPLSWDLWLAIVVACIFVGLVLRILERRVKRKRKLGKLFWFPLAVLAFPERNMVANNWARFVLVVWLFTAYILMQSYTANLSSILTVGQLTPSIDKPACAGYQDGSFVKDLLLLRFNFNESKLRSYSSVTEYDHALSKGCKNEGVDVIFDEIPYIKLFLHKYGSKYKMVGTTYNSGGLAFAFPLGSPLAGNISRAILDEIEKGTIQESEKKYFGDGYRSQSYQIGEISGNRSLTTYSFAGLFTIAGFFTILALICSECSFALTRHDLKAENGTNEQQEMDSLGSLPFHKGDRFFGDLGSPPIHKGDSDIYDDDEDGDTSVEGDQQVIQDHNNDNVNEIV